MSIRTHRLLDPDGCYTLLGAFPTCVIKQANALETVLPSFYSIITSHTLIFNLHPHIRSIATYGTLKSWACVPPISILTQAQQQDEISSLLLKTQKRMKAWTRFTPFTTYVLALSDHTAVLFAGPLCVFHHIMMNAHRIQQWAHVREDICTTHWASLGFSFRLSPYVQNLRSRFDIWHDSNHSSGRDSLYRIMYQSYMLYTRTRWRSARKMYLRCR